MDIRENIAATLNEEMKRRNLSIDKFATLLTIAKSSLQKYLKGEGNPSLETLELIAKKLDLSMGELLLRGQKFDSLGTTALNSLPDEVQLLHPKVRDVAEKQFRTLQAVYSLSEELILDESLKEILSGGPVISSPQGEKR